ncbi:MULTISPECIES: hypothetical protein [Citrobacter]|uniref:hypothetical protein n=1 Tax=Citrobacter TaxID=544 RepID=UPI0015EA23F9|nr:MULTISPECIES: hypothetical protein [Citrobacter]EKT9243415.1 hypothetical protein [Citrobacter freundii]EMB4321305.1 hypothetical protein [Citrobacter freundii]MBA7876276.1 hypothetical protein [Citrobacter sp. RHBSTW-00827]MBA7938681.1 hypothetical protein [Citrobacter sp. RHBSTW-00509]QLS94735.1 hypothetical protein HV302_12540 [Citrobacter sp. RHBSTW-00859]
MNTEELLEHIGGDYCVAYNLLDEKCPNVERRFKRLTKALAALLDEIKQEFPDACYYTASGGFNLLLGDSDAGSKMVALSASHYLSVGDGDF